MINAVYQLVAPRVITVKFDEISSQDGVLVKPNYLALCHADQRYYRGLRDKKTLAKKLPMALIHEAVGTVVEDPKGVFQHGDQVVLIPNIPGDGPDTVEENYQRGSKFRSSGIDGFMQEYLLMPHDRLVLCNGVDPTVAAISEFISVAVHAVKRFGKKAVTSKDVIGVWGDGNLGYVVSFVLKKTFPDSKVVVIGRNPSKMQYFSFVDQVYLDEDLPASFVADHGFECTGGEGCQDAIDGMIEHLNPEGLIMLMGVSENKVPIFTRNILEKGLTLVGNSRSSYEDFAQVARLLSDPRNETRLKTIISDVLEVRNMDDIAHAFEIDGNNPFKTVMHWNV